MQDVVRQERAGFYVCVGLLACVRYHPHVSDLAVCSCVSACVYFKEACICTAHVVAGVWLSTRVSEFFSVRMC